MIAALTRSLSLRLLGIFVVTALLIMFILISFFSRGLGTQWKRTIQPHLVQYVRYLQDDIGSPPDTTRAQAIADRLPITIAIYQGEAFIYATDGKPFPLEKLSFRHSRKITSESEDLSGVPFTASLTKRNRSGDNVLRIQENGYSVYYRLDRSWQNHSSMRHNRKRGDSRSDENQRFQIDEIFEALLALALVLLASFFSIRHQLKPIQKIQKSVSRISDGELDHRIQLNGRHDLAVLGNSIDSMADRIQAMLDAKRQLLLAISHELRTPLTRARIATELFPDSANRQRLEEDLNDMQTLISDIMESERLQSNHGILEIKPIDIRSLIESELDHYKKQSSENDQIHFDSSRLDDASIDGDETRLRILCRNLVNNAMQHGRDRNGQLVLKVLLTSNHESIELTVRDHGLGIPSEHLDRLSEAFYRPDSSRTRDTGGFGMGLTLASLIAEAHGGTLTISSKVSDEMTNETTMPSGTSVTLTLPRNQSEPG